MFMSEMDDAMLDHGSNMPEETDPHHVDPLEEDLQEISNNFFDFVSKAKQAGSALLEAANRSVLGGPLGDTLAPEPVNNQPAPRHRPIIGVMGSGTYDYLELTEPLGRWIAKADFHLLTGGGGGTMHAVSRAFTSVNERHGASIGIVPCSADNILLPKDGYPNPYVEIPIMTQLPPVAGESLLSRNHINALTATVMIALPGAHGTASEVQHALRYNRPVCLYIPDGYPMLQGIDINTVTVCHTLDEVASYVHTSLLADMTASVEYAAPTRIAPPVYASTVLPANSYADQPTSTSCAMLSSFTQTVCVETMERGLQVDIYDGVTAEVVQPNSSAPGPREANTVISYQPSSQIDLVTPVFELAHPSSSARKEDESAAALELQLAMATTMEADGNDVDNEEAYQLLPSSPGRRH
eukprot:TRINITY_DN11892_c0_g2_i1.p1 TRINITY_DN11892_c0_g2~~TRINITY_DN11892_c0_g2_i1.p1  ORF type:complete len:411 (+),score=99.22 TRINITY_DN11892_c0_g2_i1:208-1440(+)